MNLLEAAKQGSRVFKITFPTGEIIPFSLLSWEEFNQYWTLSQKGTVPSDIVEDAIFRKCCIDETILEQAYGMRAGVISTVVGLIMRMSGPADPSTFNADMEIARSHVDTLNSQIIMIICRAFPAYKPEEVTQLSWRDVLLRLAQAERILMKMTPPELTEPIRLLAEAEQKKEAPGPGKIDVNQLIKEGRQDAGQMGLQGRDPNEITDLDRTIGNDVAVRQKRRAMARRIGAS